MNLRLGILIFTLCIGFFRPTSIVAEEPPTNSAPTSLTIDGIQYENIRWSRVTPATVTIFHKTGVATVPLAKLPPDLQKKFGYDPQKAAEWTKTQTKAAQERVGAQQEAQPRESVGKMPAPQVNIPSYALPSNLPPGVHFSILSETGASEPFAPFEALRFQIGFEDPDSYQGLLQNWYKFSVSGRSTINGTLFPRSVMERLRVQASGDAGKFLNIEVTPVRNLLPPRTGRYNIQVVLDTPKGRWMTPLTTVEVYLPEADQESLKFLVQKGGSDFFTREVVLRTRSESHLRQPPYSVIKEFIETFPNSSINTLIVRHAEHARALDGAQGPNYYLDRDREQLAEIIALAHPSMVQQLESQRNVWKKTLSETTDPYGRLLAQKDIDGFDRWIALLEKYTR